VNSVKETDFVFWDEDRVVGDGDGEGKAAFQERQSTGAGGAGCD
jgi:hypothetical protein